MMKTLCRNFEKSFLKINEKNGFKKNLLALPPSDFFPVYTINK